MNNSQKRNRAHRPSTTGNRCAKYVWLFIYIIDNTFIM